MIVNRTATGWEVIYQPAHALLAAQLASHWRLDSPPQRWHETYIAIAQHDNGWHEWERTPRLTDEGYPVNFTQTTLTEAAAQWQRGVARGLHQSRWVGLLISFHATSLYRDRRGESPELDAFLAQHTAQQQAWMAELGVNETEVSNAYLWIKFMDWLSLILCWQRLPPTGDPLDVGIGPDGEFYRAYRSTSRAITLSPWPFTSDAFAVSVESRTLPHLTFPDAETFRTLLDVTSPQMKQWYLEK